jgi:hypothetical protein
MASRKVMTLRVNDRVEDRSLFSGEGVVAYLSGNEVHVRFDNGIEEVIPEDHFRHHSNRKWLV